MGGWLGAIGSIFSWLGGESIAATVARIAIGYGVSALLNRANSSASESSSTSTPQGTRQQISPATDNKLPVAYGDSYFSGTIVDVRTINDNKELFAVIDLCEITGDLFSTGAASNITIDDIYLNNQRIKFKSDGTTIDYTIDDTGVQDDNASDLCGIYLFNGSSNNPVLPCQTGTTTPIAGTVPPVAYEIMPGWDNTYTNQNKVFAIVKVNYDPSKGLHSIPTLKFHVRNSMNKPGDVLHDYMTNVMYGAGLPESAIDEASITALNSFSDELITLGNYPAQPRYRINGLVRTTENVLSNMEKLAAAAGSYLSFELGTGKWSIIINKSTAKTLDFDDSNILGNLGVSSSDLSALYNKVEVQFPYKVLKDQFNYVRFDLPEIFLNANEPANTLQITHEFVNDVVQATVLANLDLRQSREDIVATFKTDYSKYNVAIGTVIGITNDVYGWNSKLFKVIRIKKNESDSGQLTLEITAQSYNEDVYTVEDITDFVPLIGAGHSLPSRTPIQQPEAPLVTSTTLSSQPAVFIRGVVPEGIVTEMEFWYTADTNPVDNDRLYTLLGTMRSENGGPFDIGDAPTFKTVLLASGNYYFKVRANNNGTSTSKFSPPSTALSYTYVQAPDVLKYSTPTVDESGIDLASVGGGLSLGLMAAYLATKLNWFGNNGIFSGNATMQGIFGIGDEQAQQVTNSVAADKAGQLTEDQIKQIAQGAAQTAATTTTNSILANVSANGTPIVSQVSSTLLGHVFPCVMGSGPTHGKVDSRAAIFTHDHLVFGGGAASLEMKPENIITGSVPLEVTLTGTFQNFYNIPSLNKSWSQKPVYDETLTDKYAADTKLTLYYSECTYSGGSLDSQSWSPWKKMIADNGVRGSDAHQEPIQVWTNPPPAFIPSLYIVEEIKDTDGVGDIQLVDQIVPMSVSGIIPGTQYTISSLGNTNWQSIGADSTPAVGEKFVATAIGTGTGKVTSAGANPSSTYDPFKPNVLKTIGYNQVESTKSKTLTVTLSDTKTYDGTKLVIFGTSPFNLPDGTPFANNTVFGHLGELYANTYPEAVNLRQVATNGSVFVGINSTTDKVVWSSDGETWTPIVMDADVTNDNQSWINMNDGSNPDDTQKMPPFKFIAWDGSKFIAWAPGTTDAQNAKTNVATSTDGKTWTEPVSSRGLHREIIHVIAMSGHYLALGVAGVQTSADGISWSEFTLPASLGGRAGVCGVWDGSKFIMGTRKTNGVGAAMMSSVDGLTWTAVTGINTGRDSRVSTADADQIDEQLALQNNVVGSKLP